MVWLYLFVLIMIYMQVWFVPLASLKKLVHGPLLLISHSRAGGVTPNFNQQNHPAVPTGCHMEILRRVTTSPLCSNLRNILWPALSVTRSFGVLAGALAPRPTGPALQKQLLAPSLPLLTVPSCGFKQVGRLKRRCKGCYVVIRQGRPFMQCKLKPRHKQMGMVKDDDKTWIMTHASMSPARPW